MKIPRNINYKKLVKSLEKYGFKITRRTGSHIRLTAEIEGKVYHLTIPAHNPIKIGTLNSILDELSKILKIQKIELIKILFN